MGLVKNVRTHITSALTAGAIAVCFAGTASAAIIPLGGVTIGTPAQFQGQVPSGPFTDFFTFALPANGGSGYSVVNFPLVIPQFGNLNAVIQTMSLASDPDGIVGNSDDAILATVSGGNFSLSWGPTSGGNMYLRVTGEADGSLGGLYNGAISALAPIPARVPEPAA